MDMIPRGAGISARSGGTSEKSGLEKICIDINQNVSNGSGSGGGGNGGGTMDHEQLTNRLGSGGEGEAWHMTSGEREQFLARLTNRPGQPLNLSPEDGEKEVYQYPRFVGSKYHHPNNVPMAAISIRIATDAGFANVVLETSVTTSQPSFLLPAFDAVIAPITTYYWSIQYIDDEGNVGEWSDATSFTTGMEFADTVVLQPQIVIPVDGAKVPSSNPMLATTPFQVAGTSDLHAASDWQIAGTAQFDADHVLYESLDDAENLTSLLTSINLTGGTDFYARARHKAENMPAKSPWSPVRHFSLKSYYDDYLIGLAFRRLDTGYLAGRNIDIDGNAVMLPAGYFDTHPLFMFPEVVIADQHMLMCPEVYVRCEPNAGGDDYRFWISPYKFEGSYLHPAFAQSDGAIYFGKYLSDNGVNVNSLPTATPFITSETGFSPLRMANWLNTDEDANHKGWHCMSVYDYMLIQLLWAVEKKTINMSSYMPITPDGTIANGDQGNDWRGFATLLAAGDSSAGTAGCMRAIPGFYINSLTSGSPFVFYIGSPGDLASPTFVQSQHLYNGGTSATAMSIKSIVTGYSEALGFDLDLLFLIDGSGAGFASTQVIIYPNSSYGNLTHCAVSKTGIYDSSALCSYCSSFRPAAATSTPKRLTARVGKWTK